jgi:hypothetical protein
LPVCEAETFLNEFELSFVEEFIGHKKSIREKVKREKEKITGCIANSEVIKFWFSRARRNSNL